MATVYLTQDLKYNRLVALKVLHVELGLSEGLERFLREIEITARLDHPHILPVLDSGDVAGLPWYTMPYVQGESLRDRLRRDARLPVDEALKIAQEIADALEYAHSHGIIHRDIKPENILLADGHARVADFGIARALQAAAGDRLTETGLSLGTPAYMSPEQATGDREVDARTDQYSLACVLYEMLAGETPYTGPTPQAVIAKRFSEPIPHLGTTRAVPPGVEAAVTRGLAKAAADRFASVSEFARALQLSVDHIPEGWSRRRVPSAVLLLLALGAVLGLAMLFTWLRSLSNGRASGAGKALAVLPFENLGDSVDAYFADGVTDAVRGKLAALPGLQVTARNSSSQYRNTTKTPQQIGEELGVQYLLTATVRWQKDAGGISRVQVTPELVQVATASTRWQQPFAAALTDVFEVQAEIADRVARALDVALGDSARGQLAEAPTKNLPAYDAFLRGEAASQEMSVTEPAGLRRAVAAYEQAVALDSSFVEAWAQLARARAVLYYLSTPTPGAAEATRRAATRAFALAPGRPEGHRAMSAYYANVLGDVGRAFSEDSSALALTPINADLLVAVARKEMALSRWATAVAHLEQARQLDPRSVLVTTRLGFALFWLRRYGEALRAYDRALALAPANLPSFYQQASVFLAQGDLDGARKVLAVAAQELDTARVVAQFANGLSWILNEDEHAIARGLTPRYFDDDRGTWGLVLAETHWLMGDRPSARVYADSARMALLEQAREVPNDPAVRVGLGVALAYLGRRSDAIREGELCRALLSSLRDAISVRELQYQLVQLYVLVDEPEKALDNLEPLLKSPSWLSVPRLRIDPSFGPLRGNPRFERLVNAS
jgi:eukaryotic-like serine/threonine-protein kinase